MNMMFYAIAASLMWGVAYTALVPVSGKLQAPTINAIYGFATFMFNSMIVMNYGIVDYSKLFNDVKLFTCLGVYIVLNTLASLTFLSGYDPKIINPGVYSMIGTSYPIITMILSYILFNKTFNLYYGSIGIIFVLIGFGFLTFSKNQ